MFRERDDLAQFQGSVNDPHPTSTEALHDGVLPDSLSSEVLVEDGV